MQTVQSLTNTWVNFGFSPKVVQIHHFTKSQLSVMLWKLLCNQMLFGGCFLWYRYDAWVLELSFALWKSFKHLFKEPAIQVWWHGCENQKSAVNYKQFNAATEEVVIITFSQPRVPDWKIAEKAASISCRPFNCPQLSSKCRGILWSTKWKSCLVRLVVEITRNKITAVHSEIFIRSMAITAKAIHTSVKTNWYRSL